jgi:hypothetical protein
MIAVVAAAVLAAHHRRNVDGSGEQRRWALSFRASLEQPGQSIDSSKPLATGSRQGPRLAPLGSSIDVELRGEWVSTIVAVRSSEYDAALELANLHVESNLGIVPAGASEQIVRRLAHRFWATYTRDGALVELHFPNEVSASDRNLLQTIATETAFVRAGKGRPVWSVIEHDGAGSYLAIYQQAAPNSVVKRKLKYLDTNGVACW